MLLNRLEFALMNNPVRAALQRRLEASRLLAMGGPAPGRVLEIGCGRGVGAQIVLDRFGADSVDGFDQDPRMVVRAHRRHAGRRSAARFWVGDAARLAAADASYAAVFDFGILHHVPDWRAALAEVRRVLAPGGRLYAEEVLASFIRRTRWLLDHPRNDRFDGEQFRVGLEAAGLRVTAWRSFGRSFGWVVAERPIAARG